MHTKIRKIAKDIVRPSYIDREEIQIVYAIGMGKRVTVHVDTFGCEWQSVSFIDQHDLENYELTPNEIIWQLDLLYVNYNKVSAYGHFINLNMR